MNERNKSISAVVPTFESKKRAYFVELGLTLKRALGTHALSGLRELDEDGKKEWGNVSEHCITEAARAKIFARLLSLDEVTTKQLVEGAMLHDHNKRYEVEIGGKEGLTWSSYAISSQISRNTLEYEGYDKEVITIAESAGHEAVADIEAILYGHTFSDLDIARIIMHYVDDYTVGSSWVDDSGNLEERMLLHINNPRYKYLNEEGRNFFDGETTFEAMLRVGKMAEAKLAELIAERNEISIPSSRLAEYVDEQIKDEINDFNFTNKA